MTLGTYDESATTCEQPWRFNGKELDAETGLYYYGARYYDPSPALWYGVDAMAGITRAWVATSIAPATR